MRKTIFFILIAGSLSAHASNGRLMAAAGNDQVPSKTIAVPVPAGEFEHKPVSFSWALDPTAGLEAQAPFVAESREFWTQVDSSQLARGFSINTTAPGALIRVSPIGSAAAASSETMSIGRNGTPIDKSQSFAHTASTDQLKQAGMNVSNGTAVVQLNPGLGKGQFTLAMKKANGRYLVHVYEPNSPYALSANASRTNLLAGGQLDVNARLGTQETALTGTQVSGLLVAPDGQSFDMSFSVGKDGIARSSAPLPVQASSQPGLWEVQVFAGGVAADGSVQRDARTAISVTQPTASLEGGYDFDAQSLHFTLPVQVAAEGRYELRGTLYATGSNGLASPVSEAHSAAWFTPGQHPLELGFDRTHVPAGYGAPFELRNVELTDQTRMGKLETRELAVRAGGSVADRNRE